MSDDNTGMYGPSLVVSCITGQVYEVPSVEDIPEAMAQAEEDDNTAIAETYEEYVTTLQTIAIESLAQEGISLPPLVPAEEEEVVDE